MTFYLGADLPITSDYWEPRQTQQRFHFGWDHPCPRRTPIRASETVSLHLAIIRQHGDFSPDLSWPDGTWFPYSRYYEWWAGGIAVGFGKTFTYVFLHVDLDYIYERWKASGKKFEQEKLRARRDNGGTDYTKYVLPEVNMDPIHIPEGEYLAPSGIAGYDTAPHLHVQVMKPGKGRHEFVDPAEVWPERYARLCANKTDRG